MCTRVPTVAAVVLVASVITLFSACSSPTTPAPAPTSLSVTGTVPAVGQTSQLTAKANLSNNTTQDVTAQATWSSSNTANATVTATGLLKVLQLGGATITATYQGLSGTFPVFLSLTSVTIAGPTSLTVAQPVQFTATANFASSPSQDVTAQAIWSSTANYVSVSPQGLVTPLIVAAPGAVQGGVTVSAFFLGTTGQSSQLTIAQPCSLSSVIGSPNWTQGNDADTGAFLGRGAFNVSVQGPPGCAWTTLTFDLSLSGTITPAGIPSAHGTVTSGANGTGSGRFSLLVDAGCPAGAVGGVLIQPSAAANLPLSLRAQMSNLGVAGWTCR